MKVNVVKSKRGRKCSFCSSEIEKDTQFLESMEWQMNVRYPVKKNICLVCVREKINLIPYLKSCLRDLESMEHKFNQI